MLVLIHISTLKLLDSAVQSFSRHRHRGELVESERLHIISSFVCLFSVFLSKQCKLSFFAHLKILSKLLW